MKPPANSEGDRPDGSGAVPTHATDALALSEVEDLEQEIAQLRKKASRHGVWAVLGIRLAPPPRPALQ